MYSVEALTATANPMNWQAFLGIAVSILAIVNGLMLLRAYLRDKPILVVEPIHPETYQWFFDLPGREFKGDITRKFGFLAYLAIKNKGIRNVSLDMWHLRLKTKGGQWIEQKPYTISEPQIRLGQTEGIKTWPVLGIRGEHFSGETIIQAGCSIAGFAYYVAEFFGEEKWNPTIKNAEITGWINVRGVYGNKARCRIIFKKIELTRALEMVPGIDKLDLQPDATNS